MAWDIGRESKEIKKRSEHPVREEDRIIPCHMCLVELLIPREEYLNLTGEKEGCPEKQCRRWIQEG